MAIYNKSVKTYEFSYERWIVMLDQSMAEAAAGGFITKSIAELEENE